MQPPFREIYAGKSVCVTGHTGFKGSWLSEWLLLLGARVTGLSLDPPTEPALFDALDLGRRIAADFRGDIRELDPLQQLLAESQPDFLFHLAAQPLVRDAFDAPRETIATNLMGSVHVLEAVRKAGRDCIVIMITTDKVYENAEWDYAYREGDPLGGHDPYSASKAAAELVISSYWRSFFRPALGVAGAPLIAVASVRGGNVLGGGDWARHRLVPDCVRCLSRNEPIPVRNRHATRPWQHVLDLLSGYLRLGAEIHRAAFPAATRDVQRLCTLCSPFNFGPAVTSNRTVADVVEAVLTHWPGRWEDLTEPDARHEAGKLHLATDKAYHALGWQPRWDFDRTLAQTVAWYREYYASPPASTAVVQEMTQRQIRDWMQA